MVRLRHGKMQSEHCMPGSLFGGEQMVVIDVASNATLPPTHTYLFPSDMVRRGA